MVVVDNRNGLFHVHGNLEVARQAIARATRDDCQSYIAASQRRSSTVDGAIAAHGNNAVVSLLDGLGRQVAHAQITSDQLHF